MKLQKKKTKYVNIRCVDCGKKRKTEWQNAEQVKRCESCQYRRKRRYNSLYVKRRRAEAKKKRK